MDAPFFIGAPWVLKFRGSNVIYEDWESQMGAMLCAQKWSDEQQCDFLLSVLEVRLLLLNSRLSEETTQHASLSLSRLNNTHTVCVG